MVRVELVQLLHDGFQRFALRVKLFLQLLHRGLGIHSGVRLLRVDVSANWRLAGQHFCVEYAIVLRLRVVRALQLRPRVDCSVLSRQFCVALLRVFQYLRR